MIGMSEAIAPVSVGMEFPLPLAPIGGESIEFVKSSHIPLMPKDIPQWEPFKEYSQSLPLVAKELGDRMEGKNVGPHVSRDRGRVVCASLPVFEVKQPEKPVKEVVATSLAPANEKPEVTLVDIASARVSQNTVVQTPESAVVSRLVETVVETLAVTPTLSSTNEGEIRIQLKSDILDGSSIKIEVKNGELKVVVEPASRAAEEILLKSQEAFQNHLAERVTAWRINVGVAVLDLRNNLKRKLEELS